MAPSPDLGEADLAAADLAGTSDSDLAGAAADLASVDGGMCTTCQSFTTPVDNGPLPNVLDETSGLAASRAHPGVLYAHNDSGGGAKFYAISDAGVLIATFTLQGGNASGDYEDIDVGPCPTGTCVFLADIGDNNLARDTKTVYRIPEPDVDVGDPPTSVTLTMFDELPFEYPNGDYHNAETLLVHPTTGDVYVATKEDAGDPSTLFKFPTPFTPGTSATLDELVTLPIPQAGDLDLSGGDIDPCGRAVLFRTTNTLYLLTVAAGQAFETIFSPPQIAAPYVVEVPVANESNGESVAWNATGSGYYTVSEGVGEELHKTSCTP